jgi:rhodanese-related sulfurtransferase
LRTLVLSTLALGAIACGSSTPEAPAPATPAEAPAAEAPAAAAPTPEASFGEVTLEELKGLVESKAVVLLDANGTDSFKAGHIPGAIDFESAEATLGTVLPADKGALVVAYCGGEQCNAWKQAATAVAGLGYGNVKHYKGGLAGWKDSGAALEM